MQRSQAIGLIVVALVLGFVVGFKYGKGGAGPAGPQVVTGPVAPPAVVGPLPKLIDLGSTTCIACKKMAPILEELKGELQGKVEVKFIDITVDGTAADTYKIDVIPTQIFIDKDGKEVFRHVGFYPKEDILAQFEKMGVQTK